jgi:isoquinoline 1-oxidoreductase alpha subunit
VNHYSLMVNGQTRGSGRSMRVPPLLWVLRDSLGLTGTKFGCGVGALRAPCTTHVDGAGPVRSCMVTIQSVAHARITTIEGLSVDRSHPLQLAWVAEQVPAVWLLPVPAC